MTTKATDAEQRLRQCAEAKISSEAAITQQDANGKPVCSIVLSNIPTHKQADDALGESEEKYRLVFECAGDAIFVHDSQARMLAVNTTACERLGYTHAELMSMVIGQVDSPAEAPHVPERIAQLLEHGYFVFETVHQRQDGSPVPTEVSARRITWDGQPAMMSICRDISERKRMETALQRSEMRLREVLENSLDASYKRNFQTNAYDYLSPVFARITGYTTAEIETLPIETVLARIHPEDLPEIECILAESMANAVDTTHQLEYRFRHKAGHYRWLQDRFTVLRDAGGQPVARIGSVRDITSRKRAEAALWESEACYRSIVEDQSELICRYRPDGRLSFVNEAYTRYYGKSRAELLNRNFVPEIPAADLALISARLAGITRDQPTVEFTHRILRPGGETRWQQWTHRGIYKANGELVEYQAVGRDITERKRIELALQASEAFAHKILNAVGDTIAVLDGDGVIVAVNSAWRHLSLANGSAPGPAAPQTDVGQNYLTVCLAGLGSLVADEATAAANAGTGIRGVLDGLLSSYSQEYACHSPGQERWFRMHVTPLEADGQGAVVAHTNITARKQVRRELNFLNSRLEQRIAESTQALALANVQLRKEIVARVRTVEELQASERKSEHIQQLLNHAECLATLGTLVASVAHEIRNANQSALDNAAVMVGIWQEVRPILDRYARENGPFQLMGLTYPARRETISNLVQSIEAGTRRTANIIGELKTLACPRVAAPSSMEETIGLEAVIASAITLTVGTHGVATGRFVTHYRPELPPVRGSAQRLEQVLINLLQNACRALTDPRQTIRVSTDYDAVGHRVLCHVQDEGVGILPEHQERLFEPFFTTHAGSGGTGLGLSLCEKIVTEHGGTIRIASELAQGTTVSVSLPAYAEASQPQLSLNLG